VFGLDASRHTPYAEDAAPGPLSVYGLSKLTGEYLVRSLCPRYLVIRTCGLYGVHGQGGKGGNFVETMLRLAEQGKPVRVVDDQTCTPSFTADVAAATVALLSAARPGVYHATNAGSCTWFEFAKAIFEIARKQADLSPISSRDYGARARRPTYSVLASSNLSLRTWREALAAYLEERASASMREKA
jgi:dTDP-4-dehydrorhamnose reductase